MVRRDSRQPLPVTKILIAAALLAVAHGSHGQELFQAAPSDAGRIESVDRSVLRSRLATLDRDRLFGAVAGSSLVLNLFPDSPDARFEATVERSRRLSGRSTYVYATLAQGGHATFFASGGIVRGKVHSPKGIFTLRSNRAGHLRIEQLDPSALPPAGHGALHPHGHAHCANGICGELPGEPPYLTKSDTGHSGVDETVDILATYTLAAQTHEGGRAEIEANIIADIEDTNQALANSGLGHRQVRLMAMERVDHDESEVDAALASLYMKDHDPRDYDQRDPTGILDEVFELQHRYAADLVNLVVKGDHTTALRCGRSLVYSRFAKRFAEALCSSPEDREAASLPSDGCLAIVEGHLWAGAGYSFSNLSCDGQYSFTHELGHSLGLFHDRYAERAGGLSLGDRIVFPISPYGFGYVNQNFDHPACLLTMMGISSQCVDMGKGLIVRGLVFSNPNRRFGNEQDGFVPAGVAGEEDTVALEGPAHASRAIDEIWNIAANFQSKAESGHDVPFLPAAGDDRRLGFVRVVNHDSAAGLVTIEAFDDSGHAYEPVTLALDAGETVHFNSDHLELDAHKDLSAGVGDGEGDWRLKLTSPLEIEVLAYIRTPDGLVASMHDLMPASGPRRRAAFFNPGSNENQVSMLRLINDHDQEVEVLVTATDDHGVAGGEVRVVIPPNAARTFTAKELEEGSGDFEGAFGDGKGKWRLAVESVRTGWHYYWQPPEPVARVMAMSLMESPGGHLTNLSTVPRNEYPSIHTIPLFPARSAEGRLAFARVVNHTDEAAEASILAYDDEGTEYGPVTLSLGAGKTTHFNSGHLESGSRAKGLSGGLGAGAGDWRLELSSDSKLEVLAYTRSDDGVLTTSKLEVLAYTRSDDGVLTTLHEAAPSRIRSHRVAMFNPGSNRRWMSSLRLVNPGDEEVEVTITGIDGNGASPGEGVRVTVPAQAARTLTSPALEAGGAGFEGRIGDGRGKWQLAIEADGEIIAMSLLESPTGHLANLSTAPTRGVGPWPPSNHDHPHP